MRDQDTRSISKTTSTATCGPLFLARRTLSVVLIVAACALCSRQTKAVGTWTRLQHTAPGQVTLLLLLTDGTVMAQNAGGSAWYRLTPDAQGHYAHGTWTNQASMNDTRLYFSSAVLRDGRVFVAGGEYGTGGATAEVYDPLKDSWTRTPSALVGFADSNCKLLPNGNVLVAPVSWLPYPAFVTVIYNPGLNNWSIGPTSINYQDEASWVKLPDDSILTVDPFADGGIHSERYISALNAWINDADLPVQLYDVASWEIGPGFLLPDGRAFFLGGSGHTAFYTPSGNTTAGSWVQGPDLPGGLVAGDTQAAMMPNGKILCGLVSATNNNPVFLYEFDPVANLFTPTSAPKGATDKVHGNNVAMLDLPDGSILYSHWGTDLYVYQPDGSPVAAGKPTISSITQNPDGSYHLSGTLLNGISEGAAFGDDAQMDSNYPLVRLTDSTGKVQYARTYNWTSTGVMTGNKPVTTEFALPAGMPAGAYSLVAVANGISSDPIPLTLPFTVTPPLALTRFGPNAILSWPSSASGFTLQSTTDLNGKSLWTPVAQSTVLVGSQYQVTVPCSQARQFFRLMHQ